MRSVRAFYPKYNRAEIVDLLKAKLPELEAIVPVKLFALFGSYAKGTYTAFSDIDVLLIYGGPPRDDAYIPVRRALDIRGIELHLYSEEEYQAIKPTIDRMLQTSIILHKASP